jgi:uncharacterized protein YigE (DUF2233 family)
MCAAKPTTGVETVSLLINQVKDYFMQPNGCFFIARDIAATVH